MAEPERGFLWDVIVGLSKRPQRALPCKWLYDERGSALFEAICQLPEYYPTRTEMAILRDHASEIAACVGSRAMLIELGSGSSVKTQILLDALVAPAGYAPIDISAEHLARSARRLEKAYPRIDVTPVCADYTRPFNLPAFARSQARRVAFFPGSTIGNFHPQEACTFLARMAGMVGAGGGLVVGVDLVKGADVLIPAYDDAQGVTAEFNRNLLRRIGRELAADVDADRFAHEARWTADSGEGCGRIEMHLVSLDREEVRLAGRTFAFLPGESIHTECSYKYSPARFTAIATAAGWRVERVWMDAQRWFSVLYLVAC